MNPPYGMSINGGSYSTNDWQGLNYGAGDWNGQSYQSNSQSSRLANRLNQEQALIRKANLETQHFWNMVQRNKSSLGRRINPQLEEEELFAKKAAEVEEGTERGIIDDNIPVERSGPQSDQHGVLNSFSELENLIPAFIKRSIQLMKYETPTPIQKHAIPLGIAGADLMCCAQTVKAASSCHPKYMFFKYTLIYKGSGKTFAFLLPVVTTIDRMYREMSDADALRLQKADKEDENPKETEESTTKTDMLNSTMDEKHGFKDSKSTNAPLSLSPSEETVHLSVGSRVQISDRGVLPRSIILAPTRELAIQIHLDARRLIFGSTLRTVCVYGGNDVKLQLTELSYGCDIVVATPGRLNDLVDRRVVSLSEVKFLVLDEADRMLDMGFEPQIRQIVLQSDMPPKSQRQTFLFSATFPTVIQTLAREFLREYVWIGVGRVGSTVENIKQQILLCSADPYDKVQLLRPCLDQTTGRTLIFVQKKKTATWLCDYLNKQFRVAAEEIHGDRTQTQRENALRQFRDGSVRILVATDVAARGLDVPAVTHVIQFDLPLSAEDFDVYVHRIGRTGRAGMTGLATAFYVAGREIGEGNGKIAPLILRLLEENNQEIPEWFSALDDLQIGSSGRNPPSRPSGFGSSGNRQSAMPMRSLGMTSSFYGNQQQRSGFQNQSSGYMQQRNVQFGWRDARSGQEHYSFGGSADSADLVGSYRPMTAMQRIPSADDVMSYGGGAAIMMSGGMKPLYPQQSPRQHSHNSQQNLRMQYGGYSPMANQAYGTQYIHAGMHSPHDGMASTNNVMYEGMIQQSPTAQQMMQGGGFYEQSYSRGYLHPAPATGMTPVGMMDPMTQQFGSMSIGTATSSDSQHSAGSGHNGSWSSSGPSHGHVPSTPSAGGAAASSSGTAGGSGTNTSASGETAMAASTSSPDMPARSTHVYHHSNAPATMSMGYHQQQQTRMMSPVEMSMAMNMPPTVATAAVYQPSSGYYAAPPAAMMQPQLPQMQMAAYPNMYSMPSGDNRGSMMMGPGMGTGRSRPSNRYDNAGGPMSPDERRGGRGGSGGGYSY